jgi:hypothetical protein
MGMAMREQTTIVRLGSSVPFEWVSLSWYVASVAGGKDDAARAWLEDCGVPVFMLEGKQAYRPRGPQRGPRLLRTYRVLSGYLFVGDLALAQLCMARWKADQRRRDLPCPIDGFLGAGGVPCRVNGAAMQALFAAHECGRFAPATLDDEARQRIAIGSNVRITVGPFAFIEGIVTAFKSGDRAEILMNLFGHSRAVTVGLDSIGRVE